MRLPGWSGIARIVPGLCFPLKRYQRRAWVSVRIVFSALFAVVGQSARSDRDPPCSVAGKIMQAMEV
jgi:hypothetical protein